MDLNPSDHETSLSDMRAHQTSLLAPRVCGLRIQDRDKEVKCQVPALPPLELQPPEKFRNVRASKRQLPKVEVCCPDIT